MTALEYYLEEMRAAFEKQNVAGGQHLMTADLRRAIKGVLTAFDAEQEDEEVEADERA